MGLGLDTNHELSFPPGKPNRLGRFPSVCERSAGISLDHPLLCAEHMTGGIAAHARSRRFLRGRPAR